MDERMTALRQRFAQRCAGDRVALERDGKLDREQLLDVVHRLSGSAGMFGFTRLSEAAERTETAIRDDAPYDDLLADLLKELAAVQAA